MLYIKTKSFLFRPSTWPSNSEDKMAMERADTWNVKKQPVVRHYLRTTDQTALVYLQFIEIKCSFWLRLCRSQFTTRLWPRRYRRFWRDFLRLGQRAREGKTAQDNIARLPDPPVCSAIQSRLPVLSTTSNRGTLFRLKPCKITG